ncbi:unnamed protein product [Orchesella dallaii]|uniref:Carboxylic ester hydrolase n=1 Tax=Orchesella dallaii TaxID=48710 RepID=A0ABP1PMM8_9HEXA
MMGFSSIYIVLVSCLVFSAHASFTEEDLIADAGELGRIKGVNLTTVAQSINGPVTPFIAFRGMRYAESTIERRFLPSIRATGRLNDTGDIYDASSAGLPCMQPPVHNWMSEDCLTINVYTPKPYKGNDSDLLPVIFFIHGGSFTIGEGNRFNGNRMMNRDVVLVSFNYRLGVLGFFTLNNEDTPGNAAMYDIVNALEWTRDYIRYFGGDPNKITIAGQSSGAVAVTHLLVSPLSRGLFQGAIANSGTALAAWGTTENSMQGSLAIAELSGCYNSSSTMPIDTAVIAECMRTTATTTTLVTALYTYQLMERSQARLGFDVVSPIVQSFDASTSFQKFLPEHPQQVFQEGRQADVPLMMGTTRHDGSYVLGEYYNKYLKVNNLIEDAEYLAQESVAQILASLGIPNEYGVYDSIAKIYLGDSRKTGNFSEMYPGFMDVIII